MQPSREAAATLFQRHLCHCRRHRSYSRCQNLCMLSLVIQLSLSFVLNRYSLPYIRGLYTNEISRPLFKSFMISRHRHDVMTDLDPFSMSTSTIELDPFSVPGPTALASLSFSGCASSPISA